MGLDTAIDTLLLSGRGTLDANTKIYGVVPAIVTAVNDPKSSKRHMMGMIEVYFPWLQSNPPYSGKTDPDLIKPWARVVMPNCGGGSGLYQIPQLGDEVLVGFEHGDPAFPYVFGSLHNGQSKVPAPTTDMDSQDCTGNGAGAPTHKTPDLGPQSLGGDKGSNETYFWRSRSGNMCNLDDKEGTVRVCERSGGSVVQLEGGCVKVLQKSGDIMIFAKAKVRFDCTNFLVHASNNVTMYAKQDWGAKADANIKLQSGADTSGVAKQKLTIKAGASVTIQAGANLTIAATQNMKVEAKANISSMAGANLQCTSTGDLGLKAGAMLSITGAAGIDWGAKGAIAIKAGGMIMCMANCIRMN